uniref:Uncharacterized protein n=1 Tax=Rhizophora mucronata TaxID=61149 RepID=A0A2P2P1E9_RHIMU
MSFTVVHCSVWFVLYCVASIILYLFYCCPLFYAIYFY